MTHHHLGHNSHRHLPQRGEVASAHFPRSEGRSRARRSRERPGGVFIAPPSVSPLARLDTSPARGGGKQTLERKFSSPVYGGGVHRSTKCEVDRGGIVVAELNPSHSGA